MASQVVTTNIISKCIISTQSFCNSIFIVRLMSMIRDSWWTCTRPACPAHQDLLELGKKRVPHDSRHVARQGVGATRSFSMPIKARQVSPFISLWWTIATGPKGGSRNGGIQNLCTVTVQMHANAFGAILFISKQILLVEFSTCLWVFRIQKPSIHYADALLTLSLGP